MVYRIGVLGAGVIGCGVIEAIQSGKYSASENTTISKVLIKNPDKQRAPSLAHVITASFDEVLDNSDIIIELIGGTTDAKDYILRSIQARKHVITANKAVIALYGKEVFEEAKKQRVNLRFGAAVGGGMQLVHRLLSTADTIDRLVMVINGTSNFVLKLMQENNSFEEAVAAAQGKGYAEQDYHLDTQGVDSAHKLAIAATLAFNKRVDPRILLKDRVQGIEDVIQEDFHMANLYDFDIKLLAIAEKFGDAYDIRVSPCFIPVNHKKYGTHPLAFVDGVKNGAVIYGQLTGPIELKGEGAGKEPTTSAILYDLKLLLDNLTQDKVDTINAWSQGDASLIDQENAMVEGFIRTLSIDRPGSLHSITGILAWRNLNIHAVYQPDYLSDSFGEYAPDGFLLSRQKCANILQALEELKLAPAIKEKPVFYRIEIK